MPPNKGTSKRNNTAALFKTQQIQAKAELTIHATLTAQFVTLESAQFHSIPALM